MNRFNSAVASGSQEFAPEETDNIRQTLALADRYYNSQMLDDSERLYQLSCQKSQLLYRNIVLSKIRQGAALEVETDESNSSEEIAVDPESVSLSDVLRQAYIIKPAGAVPDYIPENKIKIITPTERTKVGSNSDNSDISVPGKRLKQAPQDRQDMFNRGEPGRTTIYLTFDDGPSQLTLKIAAYLKSEGVAATFFVLGTNVKGNEKTVAATVAMGHRVGNHTLSHNLRKLNDSFSQVSNEVSKTAAMIEKLGGDGQMVRIPYGASTKFMISKVAAEGGQIFDWDIDSRDSSSKGSKNHIFIENTVIQRLKRADKRHIILLFHDGTGHEATITAIRNLVPRLKQEGYKFGVLSRSDRVASRDKVPGR